MKVYATVLKDVKDHKSPLRISPYYFPTKYKARLAFEEARQSKVSGSNIYTIIGYHSLEIEEYEYYRKLLETGEIDTRGEHDVLVTFESPDINTEERNKRAATYSKRVSSPDALPYPTADELIDSYEEEREMRELGTSKEDE